MQGAMDYGANLSTLYVNSGSDAFTKYANATHMITDIGIALSPLKGEGILTKKGLLSKSVFDGITSINKIRKMGEALTKDVLVSQFKSAEILEQVGIKMDGASMTADFVVIQQGKVTGVFESKVNGSKLSNGQKLFFNDGDAGVLSGKNAGRLKGTSIDPAKLKKRIYRWDSNTGSFTLQGLMMTQKEILRRIIDLLTNELKVFKFTPSYKEQGFVRKITSTLFIYQFLIYNRTILKTGEKGFLIEPYIWINVKEIEKYYKKITLNTEIKTDFDFITIGNRIANLLANKDGLYSHKNNSFDLHVFEERHIPLVAAQLLKQFKEVAFPYCLNNATVEIIDRLVNTKPEDDKVHMQNDNYRILKGLIAAKLNNNPHLDGLIKIYDKQIADRDMYNAVEEMKRLKVILPEIQSVK